MNPTFLIQHHETGHLLRAVRAPSWATAVSYAGRHGCLEGAALSCSDLRGVDLAGAILRGCQAVGADLRDADLRRTTFYGADLRRSSLTGSLMVGADLRKADLRGADLSRADLQAAHLAGADLRGTLLVNSRLAGTRLDWRWSACPCEVLRRSRVSRSRPDLARRLAFLDDERPYGWLDCFPDDDEWALVSLALRGRRQPCDGYNWLDVYRRDREMRSW